jgi:glycosyltransferase involved in cell wall biosynthesis
LLSQEYPPFIFGGIGTFVKSLAEGFSSMGIKTTVICGHPLPSKTFSRAKDDSGDINVNVIRFRHLNLPPRHTFFQLSNMQRIYKTIKGMDADIINGQCGSTFPAILKLKNLAPIVTTFHSSPKVEKMISAYSIGRGGGFVDLWTYVAGYPLMSFIFKKELSNSLIGVPVSNALKSELLEELGEAYREKMCTIHNGVAVETLDREYNNVCDDVEESNETMLFAGRLFWRKGALNLIKIAHQFQKEKLNFKIIVHGTGPLFGRLRKEIRESGLTNLDLKGFTNRKELLRSMKESKYVIIPSFYEACPMILLESMCLGKIPVMFDLPYSREFTQDGKYALLAKNIGNLSKRIKALSKDGDPKNLGKDIMLYARKKYDIKSIVHEYHSLYNKILN